MRRRKRISQLYCNRELSWLKFNERVREDNFMAEISAPSCAPRSRTEICSFLTALSTIFFPLTLITGDPRIVVLSIAVVIVCIIIFKKKNAAVGLP